MADTFQQGTPAPVATNVPEVEVVLKVRASTPAEIAAGAGPNTYTSRYTFDRRDAAGTICDVRSGTLLDKLTAQQQTTIKAFLDQMKTKADGTI